jgi:iron complex outermembrane receptor protein
MNSNYKYNKLYYALLTAGMVVSTSAQASEIEKNEKIENIIVTAQKRAQSLQEVPVSVSAIGEDTLENLKMDSAADISAQVPNLQVSTPYGDV